MQARKPEKNKSYRKRFSRLGNSTKAINNITLKRGGIKL